MHPTMMMALAKEVQSGRVDRWQRFQLRSQACANGSQSSSGVRQVNELMRRLMAGISLRPRLS